jgi:hypothetical protein
MSGDERTTGALTETLDAIAGAALEGLSLVSAAALHGVSPGRLAGLVDLADAGREPWSSWLLGLTRKAATGRLETLRALAKLAAIDAAAFRDYRRLHGAPSELDRELAHLRRVPEAKEEARKLLRELELESRAAAKSAAAAVDLANRQ